MTPCQCTYCRRKRLTPTAAAQFAQAHALMTANAAARAVPTADVSPEPPNLVAAINQRRAGQTIRLGTVPEPVFLAGYGPNARRTVAASHEDAPEPPSLADACRERRTR